MSAREFLQLSQKRNGQLTCCSVLKCWTTDSTKKTFSEKGLLVNYFEEKAGMKK